MGTLRTLVGTLILSAIAYGVYVSITKTPKSNPGSSETNWSQSPAAGHVTAALHGDSKLPGAQNSDQYGAEPPNVSIPVPPEANEGPAPPTVISGAPGPPSPREASSSPIASNTPVSLPPPSQSLSLTPLPPPTGFAPNPSVPSPIAAPAPVAANAPVAPGGVRPFVNDFLQKIQKVIEAGQIGAAHYQLSQLYNEPRLTPDEARLVTQWLDELAGTVIYSRQHLIEPAYRVRPGDTLDQIGQTYGVSGALLAKINGLRGTQSLSPGQELKVLRGPFDAVVGLGRYELTLFLQGRYAGRFPIGIGTDRPVPEGTFIVKAKEPDPSMPATAPSALPNWFGRRCMDLRTQDNLAQTGIHGTDSPQNIGRTGGHGAIFLGDRDIDDVFDILTVGSRVVVRR